MFMHQRRALLKVSAVHLGVKSMGQDTPDDQRGPAPDGQREVPSAVSFRLDQSKRALRHPVGLTQDGYARLLHHLEPSDA